MTAKLDTRGANVIAFTPKAPVCGAWTVAQHFQASGHVVPANDNYGPYKCEGAQTSELLLEFLYGVAQ
ncbi:MULTISPECIES: hypothetical protein [unclassified Sulfitobacter]|jgi:hypothetical protein|uniref:hypothetical protein n=1 Tax=unclassified Sulfitobacter TaxID=196795 RepID=UPI001594775D|nr:hypothetical protein [Sulfitobacter sp. HGT1]MBQ0803401.1 hypothetical protein [Sulfitobacter sp.]